MRRVFSVATFVVSPEPMPGSPLGRVLLIRHKKLGLWLPVGGEIEQGETPLEAARREVREKTGLSVDYPNRVGYAVYEPSGFLGYEEHQAGAKGLHMNFNFVATTQTREIVGDGSFDDHFWHPLGDVLVGRASTGNVFHFVRRIAELRQQRRL